MKKIAISLLALAAVSTAALANENRGELRDSDTYFGKYSNQVKNEATSSNAFAVANKGTGALTAFERMQKIQQENEIGGH